MNPRWTWSAYGWVHRMSSIESATTWRVTLDHNTYDRPKMTNLRDAIQELDNKVWGDSDQVLDVSYDPRTHVLTVTLGMPE